MIKNKTAVSLAEVKEILSEYPPVEENKKAAEVLEYIKKFAKSKLDKVKAVIKALEELDLAKLKKEHIVKIADLMPEDAEDLRKIFSGGDVTLNQDEITSILDKIKQNK